tara:strand:+ start:599 stop:832 length:234 start_codon:yes stop_codon:yes gene_type:complete
MIHWLQSLSENGFDVFIVVYLAILHLIYHYLMRWYIKNITEEIDNKQKIIINTLSMMSDEMPDVQSYIDFALTKEEE